MNRELDGFRLEQSIKPGYNYEAWRILPRSNFHELSGADRIQHLLGWGIIAPSAHNKQPWRVEISGERFRVLPVVDSSAPSDTKGRQTHIGVGCFAANVMQACKGFGFTPQYTLGITESGLGMVEFIAPKGNPDHPLDPLIFRNMLLRRSNRGELDSSFKLNDDIETNLLSLCEDGVLFKLITDAFTRNAFAEFQQTANACVLQDERFRRELSHHLTPNDTSETRAMPGDTFLLHDAEAQQVHEALKAPGKFNDAFQSGFMASDSNAIRSSAGVGVLIAPQDTPLNWIKTGITLEKMWLYTTGLELAMAIMAGTVEVGPANILVKARLGIRSGRPTAVFRIGKGNQDVPHSPRIDIADLFDN